MATLEYSVRVNSESIWAEAEGSRRQLDKVEGLLAAQIESHMAELGREWSAASARLPWVRKSPTHLRILAGILPWVYPEADWSPVAPDVNSRGTYAALEDLGRAGWREYQTEAIEAAVFAALGRAVISVGTGGGKTRIACGIAHVVSGDWLYVVHGVDLVTQARTAFDELLGLLPTNEEASVRIHACGWKEAREVAGDGRWAGIIVDECHGVSARNRAQTMAAFRGDYRVGLSGSALDRSDDLNPWVIGLLGPVVYDLDVKELTDMGNLSEGKVIVL